MGHSPRRIQFQLFKTFTSKMKTFIFLATAVVLTTYSSPVPNPKPQIYNNDYVDYSFNCYGSQCQQNNNRGGGNEGGNNNYDYDNYGGGRGQGGNGGRDQGGRSNGEGFQGGNGGSRRGGNSGRRPGNGGGRGSNGSQNCEDSQCQQIYPEGGIGGGVAGGNNQNCKGSQCQQTFDGKDHSDFFSDSFWDRKRNGRNRRY